MIGCSSLYPIRQIINVILCHFVHKDFFLSTTLSNLSKPKCLLSYKAFLYLNI